MNSVQLCSCNIHISININSAAVKLRFEGYVGIKREVHRIQSFSICLHLSIFPVISRNVQPPNVTLKLSTATYKTLFITVYSYQHE